MGAPSASKDKLDQIEGMIEGIKSPLDAEEPWIRTKGGAIESYLKTHPDEGRVIQQLDRDAETRDRQLESMTGEYNWLELFERTDTMSKINEKLSYLRTNSLYDLSRTINDLNTTVSSVSLRLGSSDAKDVLSDITKVTLAHTYLKNREEQLNQTLQSLASAVSDSGSGERETVSLDKKIDRIISEFTKLDEDTSTLLNEAKVIQQRIQKRIQQLAIDGAEEKEPLTPESELMNAIRASNNENSELIRNLDNKIDRLSNNENSELIRKLDNKIDRLTTAITSALSTSTDFSMIPIKTPPPGQRKVDHV